MNKRFRVALVEVLLFIGAMLSYHLNIFGEKDLMTLAEKMQELVKAADEERSKP